MAYESLAASYDRLTSDVPYEAILAFYKELWAEYGLKPESAVDLACGTGSMTLLLAREGLSVLGVDASEEMLTQAADKAGSLTENPPYFVRQRMEKLRLPAPVDLAVCCLDGVNYVTEPAASSISTPRPSSGAWTARSSWTRTNLSSASGGRTSTRHRGSAPTVWISSRRKAGSGAAAGRSTWNTPTGWTSSPNG